jgi:uncharacterized repeat protein (TIGR01451 family)
MRVYDPIAGPRPPDEECLHDGGDAGIPAGFDQEGRLQGVDPADTVAAYSDSKGRRHIAVSNRVCLCVPRYAVLRAIEAPIGYEATVALAGANKAIGQELIQLRQPSLEAKQREEVALLRGRERTSGTQATNGVVQVAQLESGAIVIGQYQEQTVTGTCVEKPVPPDQPLLLCKTVDKQAAQVGEIVTFTLRYTNTGGQPITNVSVVDSLTGRLEYVPGSAQSDREAGFTMQANDAGSLILRWEIAGKLLPGQTGTVTFQARVR